MRSAQPCSGPPCARSQRHRLIPCQAAASQLASAARTARRNDSRSTAESTARLRFTCVRARPARIAAVREPSGAFRSPPLPMILDQVLTGIAPQSDVARELRLLEVTGLAYDSRKVAPGFLFFAFPGAKV